MDEGARARLVIQRDITEEMKTAYLEYAMSVIVSRALPDVRDGLKPVQRRILYAMKDMGIQGKEWVTVGDDRVSDECQANEDQGVIPVNQAFTSGAMALPRIMASNPHANILAYSPKAEAAISLKRCSALLLL